MLCVTSSGGMVKIWFKMCSVFLNGKLCSAESYMTCVSLFFFGGGGGECTRARDGSNTSVLVLTSTLSTFLRSA